MLLQTTVHKAITTAIFIACILMVARVESGPLPAVINFDEDTPGLPPTIGGLNQVSSIIVAPGSSVMVQAQANGIDTQPVVVSVPSQNVYATTSYVFPGVKKLRVAAKVSFDRLLDGYFLQTVSSSGAVVTRLLAFSSGELKAESDSASDRVLVGRYSPSTPVDIRMDIDIEEQAWSLLLDGSITLDLPFTNDVLFPDVDSVLTSLNLFPTLPLDTPGSVAYDDIVISELPSGEGQISPGDAVILWLLQQNSAIDE